MIERRGDLFSTHLRHIGHGVNCSGVMGAGIAKTFREKFPINYKAYFHTAGPHMLGKSLMVSDGIRTIHNMFTQDQPGANARYHYIYTAALAAARDAMVGPLLGQSIAVPLIGCGIGGLKWPDVRLALLDAERDADPIFNRFNFEVWSL